ncbi:RICIN domain-containing protein [Clostridium sp. SHJSY1]|uniref:RICIN domain-containing protein n=1 Tax=Clostridium sp. SHJSY1 TaxID=2942483 RepID=UPI002876EBB4|nr:RICIN domain-containing protein [Clostridium sp. SHJSY1]MDS0528310.1 RICIN domain-containing protein [Clostridium sp. SHJSY1]
MKSKLKKITSIILAITLMSVINTVTASAAALTTSRISVHDPSIVKANGKYYLFGSHRADAVSSDLASWKTLSTNVNTDYAKIFSVGGKWAAHGSKSYDITGNLWAPDVIYNKKMKKWCMYMSVNGDKFYSSIALATADNVEGPYKYAGTVVYSGFTNSSQASETDYKKVTGTNTVDSRYLSNSAWNSAYGPNAIDPCVVYDKDGNLWMSYGSWFGGLFMLKLDNSTGLRDYSYTYATKTNSSDKYLGTKISGGYGTSGEGSYIVYDKSAGYYYLYESYCGLNATDSFSGYQIRLFRSKNINGPYTDAKGNSAICTSAKDDKTTKGIKLFGNYTFSSLKSVANGELSSKGYMSGGHNSALIDDNGQRYLVYHTRFNNGTEGHQVRIHQQFLNEDGWPVTAVYENLGSSISSSGYSNNDIVGTYEFVNHGLDATTAKIGMLKTSKISLNSDGTITGDYVGTWQEKSGSYYCTMAINGVLYKGVFFKQYDESSSHKNTMTFSLIGANNESIWGSKISNSSTSPKLDGTYYIKNSLSGLYFDIANGLSADGTNLQQWGLNKYDAQKFKLVSDADGNYSILTGASNYKSCIDVYNASSADGTNIAEWKYWGGDMQKFKIVKVSNNKYAILTKASNFTSCVDLYNMSKDPGANICQWTYWGGQGQLWELVPVK